MLSFFRKIQYGCAAAVISAVWIIFSIAVFPATYQYRNSNSAEISGTIPLERYALHNNASCTITISANHRRDNTSGPLPAVKNNDFEYFILQKNTLSQEKFICSAVFFCFQQYLMTSLPERAGPFLS